MKKNHIDINCDLGEVSTLSEADNDAALMPYLSSCNIACGGHAGSREIMAHTIKNALQHKLKIGAHPGYPDPDSFGRRSSALTAKEVVVSLREQLNLFLAVADKHKASFNHIKLHGALYNDVEKSRELANVIANYFKVSFPAIKVYGLAQGQFQQICVDKNIDFIPEGFMDRLYLPDGRLSPRTEAAAVITESKHCIQQAIALAKNQAITSSTNAFIAPEVATICLHGDHENALSIARELYQALAEHGIQVG